MGSGIFVNWKNYASKPNPPHFWPFYCVISLSLSLFRPWPNWMAIDGFDKAAFQCYQWPRCPVGSNCPLDFRGGRRPSSTLVFQCWHWGLNRRNCDFWLDEATVSRRWNGFLLDYGFEQIRQRCTPNCHHKGKHLDTPFPSWATRNRPWLRDRNST